MTARNRDKQEILTQVANITDKSVDKILNTIKAIDNPLTRGIGAGAMVAGALFSLPIFGPIGAVGFTGFWIICGVAIATATGESLKTIMKLYLELPKSDRRKFKDRVWLLKNLKKEKAITEDEFKKMMKELVQEHLKKAG